MTAPGKTQFVLLDFYGVGHGFSLTVLAERLPKPQVQVWDVLAERVLSADSLATLASGLVAENPVAAGPVVLIGSCFGAPLVTACTTALDGARSVVALSIDPVVVDDELLGAQIAALGARVGTALAEPDLAATGWVERVIAELRNGAAQRAVDEGDSPAEAEEVADHLVRHYRRWLHYLRLCRQDRNSTRVALAVLSEAGRAAGGEVDNVLPLGSFANTPDVLASDELADWVLAAAAGRGAG